VSFSRKTVLECGNNDAKRLLPLSEGDNNGPQGLLSPRTAYYHRKPHPVGATNMLPRNHDNPSDLSDNPFGVRR
ncbi:MAG: hypothetical protein IJT08_00040, partial [Alphaproteobacteria bacterium]|nr:hypothetical protein [Alphaproteobacteria bacterium]